MHMNEIIKKVSRALFSIKQVKHILPMESLTTLYFALIHPHLSCGIIAWGSADKSITRQTNLLQKRAIRIRYITNSAFGSHTDPKFKKQGILKVNNLFDYQCILFMYDYISGKIPRSFVGTFPLNQDMQQTHTTRQSDLLCIPRYSSRYAQKLPEYHLPKIWNNWVRSLPQNSSRNIIKKFTKSNLLLSYPEHVKWKIFILLNVIEDNDFMYASPVASR